MTREVATRLATALCFLAAALCAPTARAGLIRVDFAGSVVGMGSSAPGDPAAAIGGSIQIGTRFSGYFLLDDAAAPVYVFAEESASRTESSVYDFAWPAAAMHTEVGSYATETSFAGYGLQVSDNEVYTASAYPSYLRASANVAGRPSTPGAGFVLTGIQFDLHGAAPGLPLHSTSLAAFPWTLDSYPERWMRWYFNSGDGLSIDVTGRLDQLSAAAVPEPVTSMLIALAVCAVGFRRIRAETASVQS